ncbi:MAG: flagellin, partial [Marinobacter sp.]|nr:flagellin [Marinobacter sp.]
VGNSEAFPIPNTNGDASAKAKAEAIEQANIPGLPTVSATNVNEVGYTEVAATTTSSTVTFSADISVGTTSTTVSVTADDGTDTITDAEFAQAVNEAGIEGFSATDGTAGLVFTQEDGKNFTITSQSITTSSGGTIAAGTAGGFETTAVGSVGSAATQYGQIALEALDTLTIGGNNPEKAGFAAGGETIAPSGNLEGIDIRTVDGANDAIKRVDSSLTTINGIRSELGAIQNRFESTIANLSTTSENLSAANSRIRDADFAKETAELSRTQVLQQAGLSVLSQANARPQQVLQLLQG